LNRTDNITQNLNDTTQMHIHSNTHHTHTHNDAYVWLFTKLERRKLFNFLELVISETINYEI